MGTVPHFIILKFWVIFVFASYQNFVQHIKVFQNKTGAAHDRRKRIVGDFRFYMGLRRYQSIKAAKQASAADEINAAVHNIG